MNKDIAKVDNENKLRSVVLDFLAPSLIGKNISPEQKELAIRSAIDMELNPARGEVFFLPMKKNIGTRDNPNYIDTIQTVPAYDMFLKRAEGKLDGFEIIFEGDEFDERGIPIKINPFPKWTMITIWRKDMGRPTKLVYTREQLQGSKQTTYWKDDPRTMMQKCTIARSFRVAFPDIKLTASKEEMDGVKIIEPEDDFVKMPEKPEIKPPQEKKILKTETPEEEFNKIEECEHVIDKPEDYMEIIKEYIALPNIKTTKEKTIKALIGRINAKLPKGMEIDSLDNAPADLLEEQVEAMKKYIESVKGAKK